MSALVNGSRLRFGIIGTGEFAQLCHIPGLKSHPQAEVVALCGRRRDHTRAIADRIGIPEIHTDYKELCSRGDLDGVTIVTPNVCHGEQAIAALQHGKHVFCEKPLAMTVSECEEMVRAAELSGKVHQVAFTFRYLYGVQELKHRVQKGDIGAPYYVRIQYDNWTGLLPGWQPGWWANRDIAGGGMLYELGSHLFDIVRFLFGPFKAITGFAHNIPRRAVNGGTGRPMQVETDDIASACFVHRNGLRGQWFISRATSPFAENGYLEVIGSEGALRAALSRGKNDSLQISRPSKPPWEELPLTVEARDGQPHCLGTMMRSFVDACVREKLNENFDASFYDGLAAQQAIAAVIEANDHLNWVPLNHAD